MVRSVRRATSTCSFPARPPTQTACSRLAALPDGIARELDAEVVARTPVTVIGDDPRVDVLTVAWAVTFEQAWPRRMVRRIAGVRVPYLSLEDLIRSKQTGRAQDAADLEVLVPRRSRKNSRSRAQTIRKRRTR
jgi:hypothetical protein